MCLAFYCSEPLPHLTCVSLVTLDVSLFSALKIKSFKHAQECHLLTDVNLLNFALYSYYKRFTFRGFHPFSSSPRAMANGQKSGKVKRWRKGRSFEEKDGILEVC